MPKNRTQNIIFTAIMVIVMVYAMICYNIALAVGSMTNDVFLKAFHELMIMGPVGFILDFFLVGKIAGSTAKKIVGENNQNPFFIVLAISAVSVAWMCPLMSFVATILFKNPGNQILSVWLQTSAFNFPMAFFWQIFYAGPLVRRIFSLLFNRRKAEEQEAVPETN